MRQQQSTYEQALNAKKEQARQFINNCCLLGPHYSIPVDELYDGFFRWLRRSDQENLFIKKEDDKFVFDKRNFIVYLRKFIMIAREGKTKCRYSGVTLME